MTQLSSTQSSQSSWPRGESNTPSWAVPNDANNAPQRLNNPFDLSNCTSDARRCCKTYRSIASPYKFRDAQVACPVPCSNHRLASCSQATKRGSPCDIRRRPARRPRIVLRRLVIVFAIAVGRGGMVLALPRGCLNHETPLSIFAPFFFFPQRQQTKPPHAHSAWVVKTHLRNNRSTA